MNQSSSRVLLILALLALPRSSRAGEPGEISEGRRLFTEGVTIAADAEATGDRAKFEAARQKFTASFALEHVPNALLAEAHMEAGLGLEADAMRHLRAVLRLPSVKPETSQDARKLMAHLASKLAAVTVIAPEGAALSVDGTPLGQSAPLADPVDVTPGHHVFHATLGAREASQDVTAVAGAAGSVTLDMTSTSATTPVLPSPSSTAPRPSVSPTAQLPPDLPPPQGADFWNARRDVGVVIAGAGVVALGFVGYFAVQASDQQSNADGVSHGPSCVGNPAAAGCSSLQNAHDNLQTDHDWALGLTVGGVVTLAAGAALILWPGGESSSRVGIIPAVSPTSASLQIRGTL